MSQADPSERQWRTIGGSPVTLGDSLPVGTYVVELPNEHGAHSVQIGYDATFASSGGVVEVTDRAQEGGVAIDAAAEDLWAPTPYTTPAVVAGTKGSKVVLIPDILVGVRRFVLVVTTPGVARVYVR